MSEKKRDAGYRAALTGAKGTVRLLIYVCVILVITRRTFPSTAGTGISKAMEATAPAV